MNYISDSQRYNRLPYNRCGNSGLLLPAISLGLWHNFGEKNDYHSSRDILLHSFDNGITHFDLANNYGPPPGTAEETMGKVLKSELGAYRDEMIISSKSWLSYVVRPIWRMGIKKHIIASIDQSLNRMGLEYVDIFYSHRPDPYTPIEETMNALAQIIRSGKALYVGLSNYSAEQTLEASNILNSLGIKCLIHQPKYNMFNRWIEDELLDLLDEKGMGCIPFSPLAQGLLTDKYINGIPVDSRIAGSSIFLGASELTKERLQKISSLNELALCRDQSLAQMALAWILKDKRITSVLIGASKISQIDDNLRALNKPEFTSDELQMIEQILAA